MIIFHRSIYELILNFILVFPQKLLAQEIIGHHEAISFSTNSLKFQKYRNELRTNQKGNKGCNNIKLYIN